jgi:hypothetical protein
LKIIKRKYLPPSFSLKKKKRSGIPLLPFYTFSASLNSLKKVVLGLAGLIVAVGEGAGWGASLCCRRENAKIAEIKLNHIAFWA